MKPIHSLKDKYIQLVESFISALESGRSWTELEDIRHEIRTISGQLSENTSVENHTQELAFAEKRPNSKQHLTDKPFNDIH